LCGSDHLLRIRKKKWLKTTGQDQTWGRAPQRVSIYGKLSVEGTAEKKRPIDRKHVNGSKCGSAVAQSTRELQVERKHEKFPSPPTVGGDRNLCAMHEVKRNVWVRDKK